MSVTFSDPRNSPAFTFLNTNSNGVYTYNNPDATLQSIQAAFNVLLTDINSFNNATSTADLDKYSLNILNDLQSIVTFITPCASSTTINKCSTTMCTYVGEIQLAYVFFQIVLTDLTNPDSKKTYDFLPFYAQNYLAKVITDNSSNLIPGQTTSYALCSSTKFQPPSTNPDMAAAYAALTARENSKLVTVQNTNTAFNLIYVAIALLILIVVIYIVKIMFFNTKNITKKIGGLRPGPPNYVRLV